MSAHSKHQIGWVWHGSKPACDNKIWRICFPARLRWSEGRGGLCATQPTSLVAHQVVCLLCCNVYGLIVSHYSDAAIAHHYTLKVPVLSLMVQLDSSLTQSMFLFTNSALPFASLLVPVMFLSRQVVSPAFPLGRTTEKITNPTLHSEREIWIMC